MIREIQHLAACYKPGAELWVVPTSPNSSWFKKLNWYCASQLTLWKYKQKPSYSEKLSKIVKTEALPFTDKLEAHLNNILVDTTTVFPNRAVLALDVSLGLEDWLEQLNQKATKLNSSSLRIFWGQSQLKEMITGLKKSEPLLNNFTIEIVTCEPDKL